jgi:hypothetical protein
MGSLQDPINGAIGRRGDPLFGTFPSNGRGTDLGIGVFFELDPDVCDYPMQRRVRFARRSMGGSRMILKPMRLSGLVPIQPFEEPRLGPP